MMNGAYKEYHPDGKTIKITVENKNDKKNGAWKEFDSTGKLISTKKYKDDVESK